MEVSLKYRSSGVFSVKDRFGKRRFIVLAAVVRGSGERNWRSAGSAVAPRGRRTRPRPARHGGARAAAARGLQGAERAAERHRPGRLPRQRRHHRGAAARPALPRGAAGGVPRSARQDGRPAAGTGAEGPRSAGERPLHRPRSRRWARGSACEHCPALCTSGSIPEGMA